jgi:hypothetical protein
VTEPKELTAEEFLGRLREARKTGTWWIRFTTDADRYELHVAFDAEVYLSPSFKEMSEEELFTFTIGVEKICRSRAGG